MLDDRVEQDLAAGAQIGTADPLVPREAVVRWRAHGSIGPDGRGRRRVVVARTGGALTVRTRGMRRGGPGSCARRTACACVTCRLPDPDDRV
ncbi:hypothetical protein GCM10010345_36720 [Streptomyces canarius]|uniref:Uncharacterized protein n=1 Tax=Streptomyces canarius TaxID=285453 RepID=A0ABQ3CNZ7_9ACTN|nr:hypothetical protein GCM10010345_36720 [Streptomyces canarius]